LGDAVLAAQTRQHDADLFLCRELPPGGPPDRLDNLLCRFLHRPGSLSHLRSFNGYDGPEILPSSTRPFCLTGADAGQAANPYDLTTREVLSIVFREKRKLLGVF